MNRDKYGIISQIQPNGTFEGGDSANWMGHYVYLTGDDNPNFRKTFEVGFGAYVRHPIKAQTNNGFGAHYENPYSGCISRDQLTGIIGALIRTGDRKGLLRVMLHHAARGFLFSYNTIKNGVDPKTAKWKMPDLTLFDIWAMYLRGFGKIGYLTYPLLCILDLHLLINTLIVNYRKDADAISYSMKFMVSQEYIPTIISKLANKLLDKDKLFSNLKEYWNGWRQLPEMTELYKSKLNDLR